MTETINLRGVWLVDGVPAADMDLDVVAHCGAAFDASLFNRSTPCPRLLLDGGVVRGLGRGVAFWPEPGELPRLRAALRSTAA